MSENWYEHTNDEGFHWIGFQPTGTKVHANEHCVVINFADEYEGRGFQAVLTHQSFKDFLMMLATARETIEAHQAENDDGQELPF
jgi:hypothetical protein